jgi:hypothetical protein
LCLLVCSLGLEVEFRKAALQLGVGHVPTLAGAHHCREVVVP